MLSIEYFPDPVIYSRVNMVRNMSEGSFAASVSPEWIMNNATHMVNIMGMRQRRNRAPSMNPTEQTISANSTSHNERLLPMPIGSGNVSAKPTKASHFAMPWFRNRKPNIRRASNSMMDLPADDSGSWNKKRLIFSLYIISGVFS